MGRKIKQEWKFIKGGRMLAGLIGCRGIKTRQCISVHDLVALARHVFGINATDLNSALCQIRDLQISQFDQISARSLGPAPVQRRGERDPIEKFYDSWEWKRARYEFLKDKKRRCECCGATPGNGPRIVVDHIKPIRRFWELRLDQANLQMLCDDCNRGKGSRDTTDWVTQNEEMLAAQA
jgi:5-methylcytosine-specific restriction endonuclease McrA